MSLMSLVDVIPSFLFVIILNSNLIFDYYREFVNCTVNIQINDIRQIPIIIPDKKDLIHCKRLFDEAVKIKKEEIKHLSTDKYFNEKLIDVEKELDKFVSDLYAI